MGSKSCAVKFTKIMSAGKYFSIDTFAKVVRTKYRLGLFLLILWSAPIFVQFCSQFSSSSSIWNSFWYRTKTNFVRLWVRYYICRWSRCVYTVFKYTRSHMFETFGARKYSNVGLGLRIRFRACGTRSYLLGQFSCMDQTIYIVASA